MKIEKFDDLVSAFEKLPGVGKKSALRFAYYISLEDSFSGLNLAHSIENAVTFLRRCANCGCICEDEICEICADEFRNKEIICVVESPKDILLIEESRSYDGLYFVLENLDESTILRLINHISTNNSKEILFAFTPSINSDGVAIFLEDRLKDLELKFTKIAQGVPTGVSLENIDTLSLSKAIKDRTKV
ncbi:MAG: recombination mediator RecR [Campylobacter sp.]|nr:recombination mediator RecR [Campylobacter sp.]